MEVLLQEIKKSIEDIAELSRTIDLLRSEIKNISSRLPAETGTQAIKSIARNSPRTILRKTLEQRELLALSEQIEATSLRRDICSASWNLSHPISDSVSEYDGDGRER